VLVEMNIIRSAGNDAVIERAVITPARHTLPEHVAIILNGNRRWARERGLSIGEGYRAGARALRETVRASVRAGIKVLTTYVFSDESHQRSEAETAILMELLARFASDERETLMRENVRVRMIGRMDRLPYLLRKALEELVASTKICDGLLLTLAIAYGARSELCDAVRALARDVARGRIKAADVNENTLAGYLYTADLPDPDLLIRTGGELRLSNFLLYQAAYSELWSTPRNWPDFNAALFDEAITDFAKRQRRFGT
jgi:undecaprenyl diphosphate synthase